MRISVRPKFPAKHFGFCVALGLSALVSVAGMRVSAQSAAIALVQHANKDAGTSTSSTLAFPGNNTAGNWIGVIVRAGALNENISVSDSKGNFYRKALQFNQTVDGFTGAIYYAEGISGGANAVTVSDNISGTLRFVILEYSGIAASGSLDVTASAQGRGTAASSAPSVTTTASGDLLLGVIMTGNGQNFTAGSGYKIEENVPGLPNSKLLVEDQIQAGAGSVVASGTLNTTDDWGAALAAFKAAGGTGGTAPTITNLSPTSGGVGASVVITGTNFGATQGGSAVKFNGVSAIPSLWGATSITAPVPSGATTGNVTVTVNSSVSNGVSFTVIPPPSVTINQAAGQGDPTNASTINFTAVFSTAVTGFSNSGVALSGTAGATTAVVTGSGTTYNVSVSGMTQTGTVIATIPAGVASANGVSNAASTSTDNTVTLDITRPSVTVNQASAQADPTGSSPINFTAVFSEAVTGFSSAGVTIGGTAGGTSAVVTGSGTTYNIAVSGMTQTGTVTASIAAGKATDLAGNLNTASTSTDNTVTFNAAAPSVTINQSAGQADPTNGSTINFTAVFSASVTGFSNAGVTLSGTAGATTAVVTGSGATYNIAVSGMTQTGTVIATVPAGVASANGTQNTASTSTDNVVTYDVTLPSVTINQAASQADPAGVAPVNFTAVFSKPVTGFSNTDLNLSGTAGATTAVVSGSGTTYNIAVSGMTQTGTVIATVPAGVATDQAGNLNTASTSTDNTVTFNFSALPVPVAAYSFEEGNGTTTADSSGNNNNGTLSTGVTWTTGKSGNAVLFNGSSGDIIINEAPSLDLNGSFTMSAWVKPNSVSGILTLLIKENTAGCSYFLQINEGQIDSGFNNGSGCKEHITSNANLTAGNWYYLVAVLDHSTNTYSTYLNGTLISSVSETGVPMPNTQALVLGRSACGGCGFERLNGALDEVKVYNRAQSASEIQSIYNAYVGAPTITSLNPATGPVGTPVTITGTNFGATQGGSTVKFNGLAATPTSWSATSITAPVPPGATSGNVVVTVNGTASNGVLFTLPTSSVTVTVSPLRAAITTGQTQTFTPTVTGSATTSVTWEVDGLAGGSSTVGTISAGGVYTPPTTGGTHSVVARSTSNTSATSPASTVAVTDLAGVFTYHNDNSRDGVNSQEYALTTSTVTSNTFGKLFSCNMDGAVYAQPLWVANFTINGAKHNVILAVSMRDTVYLFDADASPCVTYWSQSLLPAGETYVANADVGSADIFPDIGILGTPVIDPSTNAVYLVAKSKTTSGTVVFKQRLHALNLVDGTERTNSPLDLTSAVTFPGNADMGSGVCPNTGGATPSVPFCPFRLNQRAGLALDNGVLYVAWASHGDQQPYHGWVLGFDASTLALTGSFNTSPNGREGGIWMAGGAPALDSSHNLYMITGNGDWDGATEFGDSVIKLNPSALTLNDWFTPAGQGTLDSGDLDFGSGGAVVLLDVPAAPNPHMLIAGGKGSSFNGELYVLKRDNLGHLVAGDTQIIQKIVVGAGIFSTEAYWQNTIYVAGANTALKAYALDTLTGLFNTSTVPQTPTSFGFPGTIPSISSSGTTNGIVWAIQISNYGTNNNGARTATPAVLHAYDATNITTELWNSTQNSGDAAGIAVKFTIPTVANGKVYVPTRGDDTTTNVPTVRGRIDVYGLKPN